MPLPPAGDEGQGSVVVELIDAALHRHSTQAERLGGFANAEHTHALTVDIAHSPQLCQPHATPIVCRHHLEASRPAVGGFDTLNRQCIWLVKLDCEGRTIGCTLSPIAETATQNEVLIYPNPASDVVQLSTTQAFTQLQLLDAQGKQLSSQHFASAYHNNIDVTHLARGIYFVQLTRANGEQKVCKFVKE